MLSFLNQKPKLKTFSLKPWCGGKDIIEIKEQFLFLMVKVETKQNQA